MREVTTPATARRTLGRLRTAAIVAALACASNGAYAAFASVVIDDFFFTATPGFFAPTDLVTQFWDLRTSVNGVDNAPPGVASGSVSNWLPQNATATGPQANATVSSNPGDLNGQPTPQFTLAATANPLSNGVLYGASGLMFFGGTYCFYDEALDPAGLFDGTSAFCTGSGSVDFFLQYDLNVLRGPGDPPTSAYAELTLDATGLITTPDGASFPFSDFASTVAGIDSKLDQQLLWTAALGAGDPASFALTGIVDVQAIPEPGVLALAALGLIGLGATRRRSAHAVS